MLLRRQMPVHIFCDATRRQVVFHAGERSAEFRLPMQLPLAESESLSLIMAMIANSGGVIHSDNTNAIFRATRGRLSKNVITAALLYMLSVALGCFMVHVDSACNPTDEPSRRRDAIPLDSVALQHIIHVLSGLHFLSYNHKRGAPPYYCKIIFNGKLTLVSVLGRRNLKTAFGSKTNSPS